MGWDKTQVDAMSIVKVVEGWDEVQMYICHVRNEGC